MKKSKSYKRYTISTYTFKTLKEAEEQVQAWEKKGTLNEASSVFEVAARYVPVIKLKKVRG